MSPIIAAIEAGHVVEYRVTAYSGGEPVSYAPSGPCKVCKEPWPCSVILQARKLHRHTAEAQSRALAS